MSEILIWFCIICLNLAVLFNTLALRAIKKELMIK